MERMRRIGERGREEWPAGSSREAPVNGVVVMMVAAACVCVSERAYRMCSILPLRGAPVSSSSSLADARAVRRRSCRESSGAAECILGKSVALL